jgi:thiamine biosynthesis lipoprotein
MAGVLLAISPAAVAGESALFRYENSRVSMACTYSIVVYGKDAKQLPLIVDAGLDEVDRIDNLMSNYKPDSALTRINKEAGAGPVLVEPELLNFIEVCVKYSQQSEGAFDITVGPLMKAWGFFRGEGRIPWSFELWSILKRVGYQKLILNRQERTIQFGQAGMELDLGGIAKGYAVDRVVEILKQYKIDRAFVSAGGSTLYGLGSPPDRDGWEVKVRDPLFPKDNQKSAETVKLRDRCLSVSGNYEKFFRSGGVTYSHIMDPRTGRPVENMLSVAVLTDTGVEGDALDDVFYVEGVEKSKRLMNTWPNVDAFLFLPESEHGWKMVHLKS